MRRRACVRSVKRLWHPHIKEVPCEPAVLSKQVWDHEHDHLIKMEVEKGISMGQLVKVLDRSSGTIHKHIHKHNNLVHKQGECEICARLDCQYAKVAEQ